MGYPVLIIRKEIEEILEKYKKYEQGDSAAFNA